MVKSPARWRDGQSLGCLRQLGWMGMANCRKGLDRMLHWLLVGLGLIHFYQFWFLVSWLTNFSP